MEEALASLGAGVGCVVIFLTLIRSHPMPLQLNLDETSLFWRESFFIINISCLFNRWCCQEPKMERFCWFLHLQRSPSLKVGKFVKSLHSFFSFWAKFPWMFYGVSHELLKRWDGLDSKSFFVVIIDFGSVTIKDSSAFYIMFSVNLQIYTTYDVIYIYIL